MSDTSPSRVSSAAGALLYNFLGFAIMYWNLYIVAKMIPHLAKITVGLGDKAIIVDTHSRLLDTLQLHYEIGTLLLVLFGVTVSYLLTRINGNKYAVPWFLAFSLLGYIQYVFGENIHDLISNEQPSYMMLRALLPTLPPICYVAFVSVIVFTFWLKWARPRFAKNP